MVFNYFQRVPRTLPDAHARSIKHMVCIRFSAERFWRYLTHPGEYLACASKSAIVLIATNYLDQPGNSLRAALIIVLYCVVISRAQ